MKKQTLSLSLRLSLFVVVACLSRYSVFSTKVLAQTADEGITSAKASTARASSSLGRLSKKLRPRMGRIPTQKVQTLLRRQSTSKGRAGYRPAPTTKGRKSRPKANSGERYVGNSGLHFSHARVENFTAGRRDGQPTTGYPYIASGRLLIGFETAELYTSACTASLIGQGVIVTAAHCVATFGGGPSSIAKHIRFIPANRGNTTTSGPYGSWYWANLRVPTSYLDGSDANTGTGVVANNDLAVVELQKLNSFGQTIYPWRIRPIYYYPYGWNYSADDVTPDGRQSMTSLGYPVNYDNGELMQRFDSVANATGSGADGNPYQWIRGGNMAPGSSGGPWLVNFGTVPSQTGGTLGIGGRNVVVGVTSWWTGDAYKQNGASRFGQNPEFPGASYILNGINYGAGNIGALMRSLCGSGGAQTRGACF